MAEDDIFPGLSDPTNEALRQLFDDATEPRLLLSLDRRIMLANKACEELFGRTREDLLGKPARGVITPVRLAEDYNKVLARLLAEDTPDGAVQVNLWALHATAGEFPVRFSARVLHVRPNQIFLSIVVIDRRDEGHGRQVRDFLDAVHEGNLLVDGAGRIVMANARAQEIFRCAEDDLVGESVDALLPESRRAEHEHLRSTYAPTTPRHVMGLGNPVVAQRRDETTFPARVVLSTLPSADEVLVSATITDLTEVEDLRGQADEMKGQFLTNVSHELRTPLTSILGSAELLEDEIAQLDDTPAQHRLTQLSGMISRGAQRQISLVEDLLTMTSIDRGDVTRRSAMTDLLVAVENVAHTWHLRAEARGISLTADLDDLPVLVAADERWIERALDCLVSNAVKFTPPGGSVVVRAGIAGEAAWIEVADTGPGVPDEESDVIFERLHRGSAARSAEAQGTGLGLAIARSIAEANGGTLTLEQHGPGAVFRLSVPAA